MNRNVNYAVGYTNLELKGKFGAELEVIRWQRVFTKLEKSMTVAKQVRS